MPGDQSILIWRKGVAALLLLRHCRARGGLATAGYRQREDECLAKIGGCEFDVKLFGGINFYELL